MKFKEFISGFVTTAKDYIGKYEQYKELSGEEKKARVDDILLTYCKNTLDAVSLNVVFKFVLKQLLIPNIPHITQIIFDLIASKVAGITK